MSASSREKGKRYEREVADFLRGYLGLDIRRGQAGRADDVGDLFGVPDTTIECKYWPANVAGALAAGVDEAEAEAGTAGTSDWVAIIKRPRRGVTESYAVVPLRRWADLKRQQIGETDD